MQIAVAQTEDDSGTSPVSVDTIFANLSTSLGGVSQFLTALAYVMGIYLTVSAVFKLKKFVNILLDFFMIYIVILSKLFPDIWFY